MNTEQESNITDNALKEIIALAEERWVTDQTLSAQDIHRMAGDIISTPSLIGPNETPLYTEEQMVEMFRKGFYIRKNVGIIKRAVKRRETPYGEATFSKIRNLKVGEELSLPVSEYGAARSAASHNKRVYGSLFKVHKISDDTIEVKRLS